MGGMDALVIADQDVGARSGSADGIRAHNRFGRHPGKGRPTGGNSVELRKGQGPPVSGAALAHTDLDEALNTGAEGGGTPRGQGTGPGKPETGTPHQGVSEPFVDGTDFTMTPV
ncbi:hypothetical protein FHS74_001770 [Nitrospirillum iridis]|uniref:Uncharacterized protein n=1 Tax=Nitrospirillum iridis TaxID=765888 RepID=A0A7X0AW90_9PROT|nr:hypothetical protein [Nitrospirillum iridis]